MNYDNLAREWIAKYGVHVVNGRRDRHVADGQAWPEENVIDVDLPVRDLKGLYTIAHELGHIALHSDVNRVPPHVGEWEAEMFARGLFDYYDLPVPRDRDRFGRAYIRARLEQDFAAFGPWVALDPHIVKWAFGQAPDLSFPWMPKSDFHSDIQRRIDAAIR